MLVLFFRFSPLVAAIWMIVDQVLDGIQTRTYYRFAYETNTSFQDWKILHNYHDESISPGYFLFALFTWIIQPLQPTLFIYFTINSNICSCRGGWVGAEDFNKVLPEFNGSNVVATIIIRYILFPIPLFIYNCVVVYGVVPLVCIYYGISMAVTGIESECVIKVMGWNYWTSRRMPLIKMMEVNFEALPQSCICLVFLSNNYKFAAYYDQVFWGLPFPVTIISLTFSIGTILYGYYAGMKTSHDEYKEENERDKVYSISRRFSKEIKTGIQNRIRLSTV
jgi:hypothetical protein